MSMPMLAAAEADLEPITPTLRLADDVAEDVPEMTVFPDATPPLRVVNDRLVADDGAALPRLCVACGDSLAPTTLRTPRGRIAFSLCREHLISAAARAVAGLMVLAVGAYLLKSGGLRSSLLAVATMAAIGAGLLGFAAPVWTWRGRDGGRRVLRVHRSIVERVRRNAN